VEPWSADEWDGEDQSRAQAWRAQWVDRRDALGQSQWPQVRRAEQVALGQGFVLTTAQARAAGVDRAMARSLIRRRLWSVPRYGTLAVVSVGPNRRARLALAATATALTRPGSVISLESAAILHGLPVRTDPPTPVLSIDPKTRPRAATSTVRMLGVTVEPADRIDWFGVPVTTVTRTVSDVSRHDRRGGLVVADAALTERLATLNELRAGTARCAHWAGARSAHWVVAHADRLAESPLESLTRACLLIGGLPKPQLQAVIQDADGNIGRVDMLWREQRVIVEVDGRLKYNRPRDIWNEKKRQDRLARAGYQVERVINDDVIADEARLVARVRRALVAGGWTST
jgi:very-short-patch-repair endonuclease/predicted transcriptional regulator of viral defense system